MNLQCIKCKGRNLCGREYCPIQKKVAAQKKANLKAKQEFFGEAPNVFVGRYGYPNINVGILSVEEYDKQDEPLLWSKKGIGIQQVIDYRTELVNSAFKTQIRQSQTKNSKNKFLEMTKEVSLAIKPVDVEIALNKKPHFSLSLSQDTMPHGPRVKLEKARVTDNIKVPRQIERAVGDTDLKAADAITELYKRFDEHYLTKILSAGNLGIGTNRKLVPTRWSITAVDDMIGKELIKKVKDNQEADYIAWFGGYLGNYYIILAFPHVWRYELFETLVAEKTSFATDYEEYTGRKEYASNTAGGYYAARHAVLEKLAEMKRQASILCLRFITNEYWAPLGVWVVREATRKAMQSKPIVFSDEELMIKYAKALVKKKFGIELEEILKESKLIKAIKQPKLTRFF